MRRVLLMVAMATAIGLLSVESTDAMAAKGKDLPPAPFTQAICSLGQDYDKDGNPTNYYIAVGECIGQCNKNYKGNSVMSMQVYDPVAGDWDALSIPAYVGYTYGDSTPQVWSPYYTWKDPGVKSASQFRFWIHKNSDWGKAITYNEGYVTFRSKLLTDGYVYSEPAYGYLGTSEPSSPQPEELVSPLALTNRIRKVKPAPASKPR